MIQTRYILPMFVGRIRARWNRYIASRAPRIFDVFPGCVVTLEAGDFGQIDLLGGELRVCQGCNIDTLRVFGGTVTAAKPPGPREAHLAADRSWGITNMFIGPEYTGCISGPSEPLHTGSVSFPFPDPIKCTWVDAGSGFRRPVFVVSDDDFYADQFEGRWPPEGMAHADR